MDKPENCQLRWENRKNIPVEVCLVNTAVGQMHCTQLLLTLRQYGMHELTSEFCVVLLQYRTYMHVGFFDIWQARAARDCVVVRSVAKWRPITSATTFIAISTSTLTLPGRSSTAPGCLGKQSSLLSCIISSVHCASLSAVSTADCSHTYRLLLWCCQLCKCMDGVWSRG